MEGDVLSLQRVQVSIDISIHALQVEGDRRAGSTIRAVLISIHALQVEGDW